MAADETREKAEAPTHFDLSPSIEAQDEIAGGVMQRLFGKAPQPRRRFGRYRVEGLLGKGAMGSVYSARDPDLDRDVALKVLHADLEADERASLVSEAKAMARLNHRNVVAVYDVGEHEGRIFVAMERVDGQSLREWAKAGERGWREIVEAYRQAAEGLAAAHEAGVVHRDFKPDNVLIGADGRVMVADFGLARVGEGPRARIERSLSPAETQNMTDSEAQAATCSLAGTPAYLAPEVIRGGPGTARADQFGFGVALYETLYGGRPFSGRGVAELLIKITDGVREPVPANAAIPARVAAVVEQALSTDPPARFQSMRGIADALAHALVPLRRRLLGPAVVAGLGASVVVGGWGYGAMQRSQCEAEAAATAEVWDANAAGGVRAALLRSETAYAEGTAESVVAHLDAWRDRWADGRRAACGTRAEDAWADRRAHCYDRRLTSMRGLVAVLSEADPDVASHALEMTMALSEPSDCDDDEYLREAGLLPPSADEADRVAAVREALSQAFALMLASKYEASEAIVNAQLATAAELDYKPLQLEIEVIAATTAVSQGEYAEAWKRLEDAFVRASEIDATEVAISAGLQLVRLGAVSDRAPEGRTWARVVEGLAKRLGAAGTGADAWRLMTLAQVERVAGNLELALEHVQAARERIAGIADDDDHRVIAIMSFEARLQGLLRHFDKGIPMLHEVVRHIETSKGTGHPTAIPALETLTQAYAESGDLDEAEKVGERVVALRRAVLGPAHPEYGQSVSNLGVVHMMKGDFDGALELFEEAQVIKRERFGPTHESTLGGLENLALVEARRGNGEKSLAYSAEQIGVLRGMKPPRVKALARALLNRGDNKRLLGRPADAVDDLTEALETLEGTARAHALVGRARTYRELDQGLKALADAQLAFTIFDAELSGADPKRVEAKTLVDELLAASPR